MNHESTSSTIRRIPSQIPSITLLSPTNPNHDNKLSDLEKKFGGFVAKKHFKKRGNYDSALDNYNQNELRQMDEALIGISNELQKAQPREETNASFRNQRKLLSKPSYANIIVKDGKVVANLTVAPSQSNMKSISTGRKTLHEHLLETAPPKENDLKRENSRKQLNYSKSNVNILPSQDQSLERNHFRKSSKNLLRRTSTSVNSPPDGIVSSQSYRNRNQDHLYQSVNSVKTPERASDDKRETLDLGDVEIVSDTSDSLHSFGSEEDVPKMLREDSDTPPIENMYEVSDTIETQYHNSQASDSKKVLSTFGSFSLRVSKMTNPQLQRSNSRSYVILGDTQSPRRIDSLPYNSSPRFDKRAPMLGSVVERDSRGMSGSFDFSSASSAKQALDSDSCDDVVRSVAQNGQVALDHSKSEPQPSIIIPDTPDVSLTDLNAATSAKQQQRIYHESSTSGNPLAMSKEERILRASMHLQDAIYERPLTSLMPGMFALRLYIFQHGVIWGWIMKILMVGHLLLVLLEPPCQEYAHYNQGMYPTSFSNYNCHVDADYEGIIYPIDCFGQLVHYQSMRQNCLIAETLIIFFYMIDIMMNIHNLGWHSIFGLIPIDRSNIDSSSSQKNRRWDLSRTLTVFLMFLDILLNWTVTHIRFSRILRPLIFVYKSRELRRWLYLILSTLPKITGLALLIFSFITVYAIIGILLFSEKDFYQGGKYEYANFNSFGKASIVLYVLMSSENYPSIMYPAFNGKVSYGSHYYALFFVSFLLCVMFFLSNLAVPYLFASFKKSHVNEALSGRIQERMSLLAAFQLIDISNVGYITLSQFHELVQLIRPDLFDYHGKEKTDGIVEFMFDELCLSYPGKCYPLDFFQVPTIILTEFERLPTRDSKLYQLETSLTSIRYHLIPYFMNIYVERFILICIFINTTILACYARDNPRNDDIIKWSDYFLALYLCEIILKLLLLGWDNIRHSLNDSYDTIIVFLAIIGKILDFIYPNTDSSLFPHSASIIISLRALRLIPALGIFNRLNVIAQIMPFMFYSMLTVWLFIYIFAVLGLEIFATQYYHDTTVDVYSDENIQFDNFVGAMMSLFQVLVSNNWDDIMYTGMYSTGSIFYPSLYFISFHFITASLLLQLVIAIYVEAFETFAEEQQKEENISSTSLPPPQETPNLMKQDSSNSSLSYSDVTPTPELSPPTKLQQLPAYLFKQTSQKLFSTTSINPSPPTSFSEDNRLSPVPNRRDSFRKSLSSKNLARPAPLPLRHSFSNSNPNNRNATAASKPMHKFVRKSVVPKSAIHSLARVHLKEFEDDELEQIKILGDVDVKKEIELREEISRKIELQITLNEKTLKEMIQRQSLDFKKIETFESLRGSFDENNTTGEIEL